MGGKMEGEQTLYKKCQYVYNNTLKSVKYNGATTINTI